MSAEVTATAGAGAAIGIASAVTGAALFAPIVGVAGLGVAVYELGKSVVEAAKIIKEDQRLTKELFEKYKSLTLKDKDLSKETEHIEKIISSFCGSTVVSKERAKTLIDKSKNKLEDAYKLLDIQARYKMLLNNFATLNDISEKLDIDCTSTYEAYNQFLEKAETLKIEELDLASDKLNKLILSKLDELSPLVEKMIREKKYDSKFYQVARYEENLFVAMFKNELSDLIKNPPPDDGFIELINEKNISEIKLSLYSLLSVVRQMPNFEDEADHILRLIGGAEKLSQKKDLALSDYRFEIDLKVKTLENLVEKLEKEEAFNLQKQFNDNLALINLYREKMNLEKIERDFDGTKEQLEQLSKELEEIKCAYDRNMTAKEISAQLRARYMKLSYRHIPSADTVVETKKTVLHKSYFITPDEKNMLCVTVNEDGQIHERVVGVKIKGMADDRGSVLEAQKKFCKDSKAILDEMCEGTKAKVHLDAPSMEYAISEDFSKIIPENIISRIREARQRRQTAVQMERRAIDNGNA